MQNEKRFEMRKEKGSLMAALTVITDTQTGVQYLFLSSGYAGGLTPLLDKDGKPLIAPLD